MFMFYPSLQFIDLIGYLYHCFLLKVWSNIDELNLLSTVICLIHIPVAENQIILYVLFIIMDIKVKG